MHGYFACTTHKDQKRVLDLLGLELQMVMNCHVCSGASAKGGWWGWGIFLTAESLHCFLQNKKRNKSLEVF